MLSGRDFTAFGATFSHYSFALPNCI